MKILLVLIFLWSLATAGAPELYKKCAVCHGAKAEKTYLGKVPPLKQNSQIAKDLKLYSEGKLNKHNSGPIMKINLKGLTEKDFNDLEKYINGL